MDRNTQLCVFLLGLLHCCGLTGASDPHPNQGFFMISNMPEVGRGERELYLYAIHTSGADAEGEIEFHKDEALYVPQATTGQLPEGYGCYLKLWDTESYPGARYGRYTGTFSPASGDADLTAYTFLRPPTKILDTGGVYTVTVYPESMVSNCLSTPEYIGVRWLPGCRKIIWSEGKRRKINQGPRLKITKTDQAGLYTIFRPTRKNRGWFVQILVIAASCPKDEYLSGSTCMSGAPPCLNGGVLKDGEAGCICPPFYVGDRCQCVSTPPEFQLGFTTGDLKDSNIVLECSELPGGDPKCKGNLVCYGDNYGCKCSTGWYGNGCDQKCPKGRYGAACEQTCPDEESDCDRFFGPMTNLQSNGCDPSP